MTTLTNWSRTASDIPWMSLASLQRNIMTRRHFRAGRWLVTFLPRRCTSNVCRH